MNLIRNSNIIVLLFLLSDTTIQSMGINAGGRVSKNIVYSSMKNPFIRNIATAHSDLISENSYENKNVSQPSQFSYQFYTQHESKNPLKDYISQIKFDQNQKITVPQNKLPKISSETLQKFTETANNKSLLYQAPDIHIDVKNFVPKKSIISQEALSPNNRTENNFEPQEEIVPSTAKEISTETTNLENLIHHDNSEKIELHEIEESKNIHEPFNPLDKKFYEEFFKTPVTWIYQEVADVADLIAQHTENEIRKIIEDWQSSYGSTTSNEYVQEILNDTLIKKLCITDKQGNIQYVDESSLFLIKKLENEYISHDESVAEALEKLHKNLHGAYQAQKPSAIHANAVISHYYTPEMKQDVATFMDTPLDQNIPTVENILKAAQENHSIQAYKALKAAQKAVGIAKFAYKNESSFLGNSPLLQQIELLQKETDTIVNQQQFYDYKNLSEKSPEFIANFLDNTGLGMITFKQAYDSMQKNIANAKSMADTIGLSKHSNKYLEKIFDTTLLDAAKNTGIIPTEKEPLHPVEIQPLPEAQTDFQQQLQNIDRKHRKQAQEQANKTIALYAKPEDISLFFKTLEQKPIVDTKTHQITIPTVEMIIHAALEKPDQEHYQALQKLFETIQVTLRPEITPKDPFYIQGWTEYKQLKSYEADLKKVLENPVFTKFKPISEQISSTLQSYMPTAEDVLVTTGIGNQTIGQTLSKLQEYGQPVIKAINTQTNIEDTTIRQATDFLGITPQNNR